MAYCTEHLRPGVAGDDERVIACAKYCLRRLPKSMELGARGRLPDPGEIRGQLEAPFQTALFGVTLEDVMEAQHEAAPKAELPLILTELCAKISALKGEATEGIFRVPGDVGQMTQLRISLEKGDYEAKDIDIVDPHVPGSLLKLWMRELERPIVPDQFYDASIAAAQSDDAAASVAVAEKLPELNRKVASFMINYLRQMARPENVPLTKMGIPNLCAFVIIICSFIKRNGIRTQFSPLSQPGSKRNFLHAEAPADFC